jgi:hypothetical protein
MKGMSAAMLVLAGAVCFTVGAMMSTPTRLLLNEDGIEIGPPPFMMTARGILMIAGVVVGVIGLIGWIMAQKRQSGDR